SFERIHRSNLIGMGILPLEFMDGADRTAYALTGEETFDIAGLRNGIRPGMEVNITASHISGRSVTFAARVRIDTPDEAEYYRNGGILQYVLRQLKRKQ
ncbi:MAG: aconitate hydratase, partial [Candidatus Eremiobacteraeota bacterium]|nr:aconitate hydratase [Candidatus Eremiobacteraeota bacterium]